MNPIFLALDSLFTRYININKTENGTWPAAHFDPPWPSPCVIKEETASSSNDVYWCPKERKQFDIFNDLEKSFEMTFPDEFKWFYGSFWSNGICIEHESKPFNLIQIWNEEDEQRLKENMLGHIFAKLKNKQAITYFIGCTDGNDIISLDHDSGEIVIEKPGFKAHDKLCDSLEILLIDSTPSLDSY